LSVNVVLFFVQGNSGVAFGTISTAVKEFGSEFDLERARKEGSVVPVPGVVPVYDTAKQRCAFCSRSSLL
jgi:hypothetical protein